MRTTGVPLYELIASGSRVASITPSLKDFLDLFVVVEHSSTTSDDAFIHHGALAPLTASFDVEDGIDLGFATLKLAYLHSAVPFQLSTTRDTAGTGSLEPEATSWRLDLLLEAFVLEFDKDKLVPARLVPATGTVPQHLVRDTSLEAVRITGTAVLRFDDLDGVLPPRLVDLSDPFDPQMPTGAVVEAVVSPSTFFLGASEYGMQVTRLLYDHSTTYTPEEIVARGQDATWRGLAVSDAVFFFPRGAPFPGLHELSIGVHDVLLGDPVGVQGELEVQFGRPPFAATTFQFRQETPTGLQDIAPEVVPPPEGKGREYLLALQAGDDSVTVHAGFQVPAPPPGDSALREWFAEWTWNGRPAPAGDTSSHEVYPGSTLNVVPVEVVGTGVDRVVVRHPEVTYRFVSAGTGPTVTAKHGVSVFPDTVHLSGTKEQLTGIALQAVSTAGAAVHQQWRWCLDGTDHDSDEETWTLTAEILADVKGAGVVTLTETIESGGRVEHRARLLLTVLPGIEGPPEPLLIGCRAGVFDASAPTAPLVIGAVEASYDLSDFHSLGRLTGTARAAEVSDTAPFVDVPADVLAKVVLGAPSTPTPPPPPRTDNHVAVRMEFDDTTVLGWGEHRPMGSSGQFSVERLLEWAGHHPGATFLIIGRTDDIGTADYNEGLGRRRAEEGAHLLQTALSGPDRPVAVDGSRIATRAEQAGSWQGAPGAAALEAELPATEQAASADWLIHLEVPASQTWPDSQDDVHEDVRAPYRRVDIWAVGSPPSPVNQLPDDAVTLDPQRRRSFVPAGDRTPAPAPTGGPDGDYRVRLLIGWDHPHELVFWPNLVDAELVWTPTDMPIPSAGGQAVQASRETYTVGLRWVYDDRTGYTKASLELRSEGDPDGLAALENRALAAALALGPALLSGVAFETDLIGSSARVAALLAAAGFAYVPVGGGETLIGDGSKVVLKALKGEFEARAINDPGPDMQLRLLVEYLTVLNVRTGALGLRTLDDSPVKIRYKDVGIEFDSSQEGWDKLGFAYESRSFEIEDPGRWKVDGPLGELLRIDEIAFGSGSVWLEATLAIALDLGIIEITQAVVRLTWDDDPVPAFEMRGLALNLDIPAVISGSGRIRLDAGVVRAGVDASIIPIGWGASAALAFSQETDPEPYVFVSVYLKVQFSTPLPLGQSGIAIYGFAGLFTMNGERALPAATPGADRAAQELAWYAANPEDKYRPALGQYALGVGVVVGTMPDVSFSVSCEGMLVVSFPSPEVILGVQVRILSIPDTTAKDQSGSSATITGLIVIDDEAVTLAASAEYTIPAILHIKAPFGGYFPYGGADVYVRLGSDGYDGGGDPARARPGEPVTITILPGTLDLKAWSYLMIEEGGLPSLGGEAAVSLEGFAVGWGAGFGIDWSAGPIRLIADAKVLVGLGTNPLIVVGGIFVQGELDLVVVSIGARGYLLLSARVDSAGSPRLRLDGEFCGSVDCFFFSVEGCVGVSIGDAPDTTPPKPESPLGTVNLVDYHDRIMGTGTTGQPLAEPVLPADDPQAGADVSGNHTVWPDTTIVLDFRHPLRVAATADDQFAVDAPPNLPPWSGSSELKYAYRLDRVELRVRGGAPVTGDGPLVADWASSPYRTADGSTDDPAPSEHEGPSLRLLHVDRAGWYRDIADPADAQADPLSPPAVIADLCDPLPTPVPACRLGADARHAGFHRVRWYDLGGSPGPYASHFTAVGHAFDMLDGLLYSSRALQQAVEARGGALLAGSVHDLRGPVRHCGPDTVDRAYRLPLARYVRPDGLHDEHPLFDIAFDRPLVGPCLTLLVCDAPAQSPQLPTDGDGDQGHCVDFRGVKPGPTGPELLVEGISFTALGADQVVRLVDDVDQSSDPATPGSDGSADVAFPHDGVRIVLPRPCTAVRVRLMHFHTAPVKAQAFSPAGVLVDTDAVDNPTSGSSSVLTFTAGGGQTISELVLVGGGFEAVVYEICCGHRPEQDGCVTLDGIVPARDRITRLDLGPVQVAGTSPFALIDALDTRTAPVEPGRDGQAEILVPDAGLDLRLREPCRRVTVDLYALGDAKVRLVGFDADDVQVGSATGSGRKTAISVTVSGDRPIARLRLQASGDRTVLYRICCDRQSGRPPRRECITFDNLRPSRRSVAEVAVDPIVFASVDGSATLAVVASAQGTAVAASAGMTIDPGTVCEQVSMRVLHPSGPRPERTTVTGLDSRGRRLVSKVLKRRSGVETVVLEATGLRSVRIDGRLAVLEVCRIPVRPTAGQPGRPPVVTLPPDVVDLQPGAVRPPVTGVSRGTVDDLAPRLNAARLNLEPATTLPVVTGVGGDAAVWEADTIAEADLDEQRACRVVTYRPAGDCEYDGLTINCPPGVHVSIVSVCGTDLAAEQARERDEAARSDRRDQIVTDCGTPVDERTPLDLAADTEYELTLAWSYQSWQAEEHGDTPPVEPPAGDWQAGDTEVFRFRTAAESTLPGPQDGLNEYVFDARDLSRYLIAVEPADGPGHHFLDDELWLHFDVDHLESLAALYGRVLELRVTRTDPAPVPGGLPDDRSHLVPVEWLPLVAAFQPAPLAVLNAAVEAADCLGDGGCSPFGGASLAGAPDLDPDADYDLQLLAVGSDDEVLVHHSRFHSSRYRDPQEMLEAIGYQDPNDANPVRPVDVILEAAASLPTGDLSVSDADLDAALAALGLGALEPNRGLPATRALWRPSGADWHLVALLVDAVEPLERHASIRRGGGQSPQSVQRCGVGGAAVGPITFTPRRANTSWTRVLLVADTPARPADPLTLTLHTSDGDVVGARHVGTRPAQLDREGL